MNTNINVEGFNNLSPEIQQSAELIRKGYLLEEWRNAVYYDRENQLVVLPDIEASRSGIIRRQSNGHVFSQNLNFEKYYYISFSIEKNKCIIKPVHSILMATFVGKRPEKNMIIDHIDRNRQNNSISNLRYVSVKDNALNRSNRKLENIIIINSLNTVLFSREDSSKNEWRNITNRTINSSNWLKFTESAYNYINRFNINLSSLNWKLMEEFNDNYHYISEEGIIKNTSYERVFYTLGRNGGSNYKMIENSLGKDFLVHRLVAKYFINNGREIDENLVVDHIDTNIFNNRAENLRIVSQSENMKNVNTILKSSRPVKLSTTLTEGEISYFSSTKLAGKFLNIASASLTKWINKKRTCTRPDILFLDIWSKEDFDNYKNGYIFISDNLQSPYINCPEISVLSVITPVKAQKIDDSCWYYFRSWQDFGRYLDIDSESVKNKLLNTTEFNGFSNYMEWTKDDWDNYINGLINLEDISNDINFESSLNPEKFVKMTEINSGEVLYFSNKLSMSKYIGIAKRTLRRWFKEGENPSYGFSNFSNLSENELNLYKSGKINLIQ